MTTKSSHGRLWVRGRATIGAVVAPTDYYVDCSATAAGNGTSSAPWNIVTALNSPTFGPGERILLRAGTTCTGQVAPKGSGAAGSPIRNAWADLSSGQPSSASRQGPTSPA